jgi:hypothetical protein
MTALIYAVATPVMRTAGNAGATLTGFCLGYALPLFIAGVLYRPFDGMPSVGSGKSFLLALVAGALFTIGYLMSGRAFSFNAGHGSIVGTIIASFPVLSTPLCLIVLGEADKVRTPWVIVGTFLTVAGVVVIAFLGTKPA